MRSLDSRPSVGAGRAGRTTRSRRRAAGLAAVVVAALGLTGCGIHPGSAVVVNNDKISQTKVDDLVLAACDFFKQNRIKQGSPLPSTSTAYLRNIITDSLITYQISADAAEQLHLTVSQASVAKVAAGQTLPAGMSAVDHQRLEDFFTGSALSQLQQAVIGAHLKDPSVTNSDNVTTDDVKAAAAYIATFTAKQHIDVSPAYGTWHDGQLTQSDGSLSAPASSAAKSWLRIAAGNSTSVAGLPASQVCG